MGLHYETIIIGGGISGLSCARRLHDESREFLLITEELGGRMAYDEDSGINLGAGFVLSNYEHVLPYVKKRTGVFEREHVFCDTECVSAGAAVLRSMKRPGRLLGLLRRVHTFKRHLERMRKRMPFEQIKDAVEKDPLLLTAFTTPARDFVHRHGLEELNERYINPLIASTFYADYEKVNTFYYLATLTPIFSRIYIPDFAYTVKRLSHGFEKNILMGRVAKVTRKDGIFLVKAAEEEFTAKHVVFAAPQRALKDVYPLPEPHIQQQIHRFIVKGRRKDEYKGKGTMVFNPKRHEIRKISRSKNGYDLIASPKAAPAFEIYYETYSVINHIRWQPATIVPDTLIEQDLGENAYLASDYNISSLEDSFLTGLYAANQIISGNRNKYKPES